MRQPHLATHWIRRVTVVAVALAVALTLFMPGQASASGYGRSGSPRWHGPQTYPQAYHRPAKPAQVQPVRPQAHTYCVQRGDTLSGIARRFGVSVQSLASANRLRNPHRIYAGQALWIPAPAHHWR